MRFLCFVLFSVDSVVSNFTPVFSSATISLGPVIPLVYLQDTWLSDLCDTNHLCPGIISPCFSLRSVPLCFWDVDKADLLL